MDGFAPLFFPIHQFHFDDYGELIKISSKLNYFGKLFIILMPTLIITSILFNNGFELDFLKYKAATIVVLLFLFILIFTFYSLYKLERKSQLKDLAKIIKKNAKNAN